MKTLKHSRKLLILTCVFSFLTKMEKALCLNYLGYKPLANSMGFLTMKLLFLELHVTIDSIELSSTMSYVFMRNRGTTLLWLL